MIQQTRLFLTSCAVLAITACATTGDDEARLAREVAQRQQLADEYTSLADGEAGEQANDGRICRVTGMTGTRVRNTRTCLTPEEWRNMARRENAEAEEILRARGWHTERD
jgi:hypothetical protein